MRRDRAAGEGARGGCTYPLALAGVFVGVVAQGQAPVRPLDLVQAGARPNAQQVVVTRLLHHLPRCDTLRQDTAVSLAPRPGPAPPGIAPQSQNPRWSLFSPCTALPQFAPQQHPRVTVGGDTNATATPPHRGPASAWGWDPKAGWGNAPKSRPKGFEPCSPSCTALPQVSPPNTAASRGSRGARTRLEGG